MDIQLTTDEQRGVIRALSAHIKTLEWALAPQEQRKINRDAGRWDFQPLDNNEFVTAAVTARKLCEALHPKSASKSADRYTFLDVGSGIGSKHELAYQLGFAPTRGIEINPVYREVATRLHAGSSTIDADALTYPDYNAWDVIYFYCPIEHERTQIKLERKISRDAKDGAILIQALKQNQRWEKTEPNLHCLNFINLHGWRPYVYLFIKTTDDSLVAKAKQLMCDITGKEYLQ